MYIGDGNEIGVILGLYWDSGKENGNDFIQIGHILGLHWESGKRNLRCYNRVYIGLYWNSGKENGSYYIIIGQVIYWGYRLLPRVAEQHTTPSPHALLIWLISLTRSAQNRL